MRNHMTVKNKLWLKIAPAVVFAFAIALIVTLQYRQSAQNGLDVSHDILLSDLSHFSGGLLQSVPRNVELEITNNDISSWDDFQFMVNAYKHMFEYSATYDLFRFKSYKSYFPVDSWLSGSGSIFVPLDGLSMSISASASVNDRVSIQYTLTNFNASKIRCDYLASRISATKDFGFKLVDSGHCSEDSLKIKYTF